MARSAFTGRSPGAWARSNMYCSLTFNEELSSFIRRSSCHIRRLTLCHGERQLLPNLMKLISSVEVFCIKMTVGGSFLAKHIIITQMNDGIYLPNLRELKMTCRRGRVDDEELMTAMSRLLETRNEKSRLISVRREEMPRAQADKNIYAGYINDQQAASIEWDQFYFDHRNPYLLTVHKKSSGKRVCCNEIRRTIGDSLVYTITRISDANLKLTGFSFFAALHLKHNNVY